MRKTFHFLRTGRDRTKTCGLSFETPLLFSSSSPFFGETTYAPSPPRHSPFLPPQPRTRGRTRPCASRTQRVRNSCLHPHTYSIDTQTIACELHPRFLLHRGEGKGGEAFTLIVLSSSDLLTIGEEVKAKNEKRRTRPRARKTPKKGRFRRVERITSCLYIVLFIGPYRPKKGVHTKRWFDTDANQMILFRAAATL